MSKEIIQNQLLLNRCHILIILITPSIFCETILHDCQQKHSISADRHVHCGTKLHHVIQQKEFY